MTNVTGALTSGESRHICMSSPESAVANVQSLVVALVCLELWTLVLLLWQLTLCPIVNT